MSSEINKRERVTKKDIIYSFIIIDLIATISLLLTWKFSKFSEAVDQISLISSIASILLALIAIIYAFVQTIESGKHSDKVQNTLRQIDIKVNELQTIKNEFVIIKEEITRMRNDSKTDMSAMINVIQELKPQLDSQAATLISSLKKQNVEIPTEVEEIVINESSKTTNDMLSLLTEKYKYSEEEKLLSVIVHVKGFVKSRVNPGQFIPTEALIRNLELNLGLDHEEAKHYTYTALERLAKQQDTVYKTKFNDLMDVYFRDPNYVDANYFKN